MQAYKIMARNTLGGQRVHSQQLDGTVITDSVLADRLARQLAEKQSAQTGTEWRPEVSVYTVGTRPGR